jgi:hypothetical protein
MKSFAKGSMIVAALVMIGAQATAGMMAEPLDDPPISWRGMPAAPTLQETGRIASMNWGSALSPVTAPVVERVSERLIQLPAATLEMSSDGDVIELRADSGPRSFRTCRIEVARRRHVRLSEIGVGVVRLRWTVEPAGDVRNAEVVAADGTDMTVAACMKRVVATRSFLSRQASLTVERTYAYR